MMAEKGKCDLELEGYKDAFRRIPHPPGGVCRVKDLKVRHIDYDGNALRLLDCLYATDELESNCLLHRWSVKNAVNFSSYSMMKNIRQESIMRSENHYQVTAQSRIVLSWIDGTLAAWARQCDYKRCFESDTSARQKCLSSTFRLMILKTCQALEHMFEMNMYPKEITLDDIFVCNGNEKGSFAIQILVLEADRLVRIWDREQRKKKLWIDVKTVFQEICNEAQVCLSSLASGFIGFIENGDVNMLEDYPDTWSWNRKACYLLYIIASDSSTVRQALRKAKFQWPKQINLILKEVLEYNKKKPKPIKYDMNDGYDYIKLCRHIVKHWESYCKSVPYLQRSCANVQDFLRKMEGWTPGIWCTLYKAMGWPRP